MAAVRQTAAALALASVALAVTLLALAPTGCTAATDPAGAPGPVLVGGELIQGSNTTIKCRNAPLVDGVPRRRLCVGPNGDLSVQRWTASGWLRKWRSGITAARSGGPYRVELSQKGHLIGAIPKNSLHFAAHAHMHIALQVLHACVLFEQCIPAQEASCRRCYAQCATVGVRLSSRKSRRVEWRPGNSS
jgi:hypothetical protein